MTHLKLPMVTYKVCSRSSTAIRWWCCSLIALGTTDGLRRGLEVENTGNPIMVPVGTKTLGRIMNVLGNAIDEVW